MEETFGEGRPVALRGPLEPEPLTPEQMRALASYETRRALERSPVYRRLAPRIAALTSGLVHRPHPDPPAPPERGFLRVVSWNIERGMQLGRQIEFLAGHPQLRHADILLLNEVDRGMARTGNRDVGAELAQGLGMHYLFGSGYLCLGHGGPPGAPGRGRPNREGLHGNAILSRHPMRRAELFPVAVSRDRFATPDRRLGQKKALWAELSTPHGSLAVVAAHLDNSTSPAIRVRQLQDVLRRVRRRGLQRRALLGGDLNTSNYDFGSLPGLGWDLAVKLVRRGPRQALADSLHPEQHREQRLFAALERDGWDWRSFNAPGQATCRFDARDVEQAAGVMGFPPAPVLRGLSRVLRALGGQVAFKLDWFAGRGLRALGTDPAGEADECARGPAAPSEPTETRPGSCAPRVVPVPLPAGRPLSDHDPVLVDVVFDGCPGSLLDADRRPPGG